MAIGDIRRVTVHCTSGNQQSVNVLHLITTAEAGGGLTDAEIAGLHSSTMATPMKSCLGVGASYLGLKVSRIHPLPATDVKASVVGAGVGVRTGDQLPYQAAGILTLKTALAGRRNRGRMYVPFPAEESNNVTGQPDVIYTAALDALGTVLLGPFAYVVGARSTTLAPYLKNKSHPAGPQITSYIVRAYFATQRRRGRASGADDLTFP